MRSVVYITVALEFAQAFGFGNRSTITVYKAGRSRAFRGPRVEYGLVRSRQGKQVFRKQSARKGNEGSLTGIILLRVLKR